MRPYLEILKLVWPLALGMINNAVMQFADRAYLARDSMASLEAVLPAGMLAWVFMGFFQSVVGYAGVFVAQYHGARDFGMCRSCYRAAVALAVVSGALMLPMYALGNWILDLTAPSAEILALERTYFGPLVLGGIFVYGQMAATAYFTGRGLTRIVFWVNLWGNLLNIALDPVLIFGWGCVPRMGIAGAAYATVFAAAVQWVALAVAAQRHVLARSDLQSTIFNLQSTISDLRDTISDLRATISDLRVASSGYRVPWPILVRILRFGIPSGLYELLNMASFSVFVFVTGGVGDVALAASNACFSVNYLVFAPMMGFALGAQTLVGQARGRGDNAAASAAFLRTLALALGFVALVGGLTLAFHRPILSLFAPADAASSAEFHSLGATLFWLMSGWMFFDAADVVVSGALKGAGDTRFVMVWMLVCSFVLWLPLVFVVRRFHNTMPALWSTMIVYVVVICVGSLVRWRRGKWKDIRLV